MRSIKEMTLSPRMRKVCLFHLDSHTPKCENEVQRIIHLQAIVNRLPNAFNDPTKVTESHIPLVNTSAKIIVLE